MVRLGISPCADSMPGKLLNLLVSVLAASYMHGAGTFPVEASHILDSGPGQRHGDCAVNLFGFNVGLQLTH